MLNKNNIRNLVLKMTNDMYFNVKKLKMYLEV